jgi:leucyl aminopeptidase
VVWADKPGSTYEKGPTGYGVRLLDRFIAENFESGCGRTPPVT